MMKESWNSCAKQMTDDVYALRCHAQMASSGVEKFARELALVLDIDPDINYQRAALKKMGRIMEKARNKYEGDVRSICDIARGRILFDDPDQIHTLRSMMKAGKKTHPFIQKWAERGIYLVHFEDCFENPKSSGYVGINMKLSIDLGKGRHHICELQLMHRDMVHTDMESRRLYERIRLVTDQAQAQGRELTDQEQKRVGTMQKENRALYAQAISRCDLFGLMPDTGHVHAGKNDNAPARTQDEDLPHRPSGPGAHVA